MNQGGIGKGKEGKGKEGKEGKEMKFCNFNDDH